MEAAANKVVSIIYELRRDGKDGEIVEVLERGNPLTFLFGNGNLLPKFEEQLMGLRTGEKFAFTLASDDAYGPVQQNAIVDVPINIFEVNGKLDENLLQTGNVIPMMDNEGRRLNGIVKNINVDTVTMDFNHPMAGSSLHFNGEVTDIREATSEELSHGHIHQSCGCSGGCGDGSCASGEGKDAESCGCSDGNCGNENMESDCGCSSHSHNHSHSH